MKSRSFRPITGAVALALAAGACQDLPTPPDGGGPRPSASPGGGAGRPVRLEEDFQVAPRFQQEVRVTGSLKPGAPINLHVTTRALQPTAGVEVRVVLPDAELARRGGWKHMNTPLSGRVPAVGEWHGGMGRGQVTQRNAQLTIPVPGYYQVVVTARATSGEPPVVDGVPTAAVDVRTLWLLVDETGGRVTEKFDPALLPAGALPMAGPFRYEGGAAPAGPSMVIAPEDAELVPIDEGEGGGYTGGGSTGTTTTQPVTRWYRLVYYHARTGELLGVPRATVWYDLTKTTITDDYGYTYVTCPVGAPMKAYLENSYVELDANISLPNLCGTYQAPGTAETVLISSLGDDFAHVYSNMTRAAMRGAAFFGKSRGQLHVSMALSSPNNRYEDGDGMFDGDEKVVIRLDQGGYFVWDTWGAFIQGHEYGHAFQHRALGGLPDDPGDGCQNHGLDTDESVSCAWQEGFADYFSVVTLADEGGMYSYFNDGSALNTARANGFTDGSRIEGAIATFLLHTTGTYFRAPVQPAANGYYMGNLVKTCSGQIMGMFSEHVWSAGSLVYCMENRVDAWVKANYFRTDFPVTAQSNSAVAPYGWTLTEIRRKWLWDLYRQPY